MNCARDVSEPGAGPQVSGGCGQSVLAAFTLSEAARVLGAELLGPDVPFTSVSTDTRTIEEGALFVALHGPRHDGHGYVREAQAKGAAAALVGRRVESSLPMVIVGDTRSAIGCLAAAWRARFDIPVVAVTGSNGKTTVKEMIAAILDQTARVLSTQGNLNNDIGVPLTLLRLRPEHRYAVIEMGANHAGEIRYLTSVAQPSVSVITNASSAHLAGFGDVRGVALAKGEIVEGLANDGTAILNADDAHVALWLSLAGTRPRLTFGIEHKADISTRIDEITTTVDHGQGEGGRFRTLFELHSPAGATAIELPLPGRHNVMNALAAAAAASALGVTTEVIKAGLEKVRAVHGRLQVKRGRAGITILDDTYNANPASLAAAVEVLTSLTGENVLVLGDMAELGPDAAALHASMGRDARRSGVQRLYGYGPLCVAAVEAFGEGARHFDSRDALIAALRSELAYNTNALVKGSRCMQMEKVVEALLEPYRFEGEG